MDLSNPALLRALQLDRANVHAQAQAQAQSRRVEANDRQEESSSAAHAHEDADVDRRMKALDQLLRASHGFPLDADAPLSFTSTKLRRVGARTCPRPPRPRSLSDESDDESESSDAEHLTSAVGGVYWIHKDAARALLGDEAKYDDDDDDKTDKKDAKDASKGPARTGKATPKGGDKALAADRAAWAAATRGIDPVFLRSPWFAQLWVQARASGMNPKPPPGFPMWKIHASPQKKDWLGVPLFFGLSHFGAAQKNVRTLGVPMQADLAFDPLRRRPFRPEQEAAYTALLASLAECGGGFVIADCGFGKTGLMLRVLIEGIRTLLKARAGVRAAIVLTQVVLMTQMRFDIVGKPWTWADLTPIELDADGFVLVHGSGNSKKAPKPKAKAKAQKEEAEPKAGRKRARPRKDNTKAESGEGKAEAGSGPGAESVDGAESGKGRAGTVGSEEAATEAELRCPLTNASLARVRPEDIVRAVCVQPPPLALVAAALAAEEAGTGAPAPLLHGLEEADAGADAGADADADADADGGAKAGRAQSQSQARVRARRPGTCRRFVSRAGYQAWLALSAAERAERARDPAFACPACGGQLGGAAAWDVPSPPKTGWAPDTRVGWLQGAFYDAKGRRSKRCVVDDCDIILVSAKSAADCAYPWASFGIGAVAFDEAHKIASPTISQIAPHIPCAFKFGVTATPARLDGTEHALGWQLGPYAYVYQRTEAVTGQRGAVAVRQILYRRGSHEEPFCRDGRLNFAAMVNVLALDAERNALILALAEAAAAAGRKKILVITSTLVHTAYLARALREQCGFYDAAVLTGGARTETVSYAQNPLCRLVVATYHFLSEGYDDDNIDTMILAAPRSSVQQAVGRCERSKPGKLVPLVLDVVDTFSAFEGMAWKRHAFYRSRAFSILREEEAATRTRMDATGAALAAAFNSTQDQSTQDQSTQDQTQSDAHARDSGLGLDSGEWGEELGEDLEELL
jgi:superfamily II DNA or RNA helicase